MPIVISVDDGCEDDLRLADLAKKYEFELIFYWPVEWQSLGFAEGYTPLTYDDAWNLAREFEVGSHSITHRLLTRIEQLEAEAEIADSKMILEKLFDIEVTKFAPPRGYTNPLLTEFTMRFYEKQRLTKGKDLVHIHPASGVNDNKPWRDCITVDTKELFCHSWELNKYDMWDELEDWLRENPHT